MRTQSTGPADWVHESKVYYFFDFHLLSIAQTFIPFIVLVVFNFIIIRKLPKQNLDQEENHTKETTDQENGHFLLEQNYSTSNHNQLHQEHDQFTISNALFEFDRSNRNVSKVEHKSKSLNTIWGSKFKKRNDSLFETKNGISIIMTKPLRKMSTPVRDAVCTMFAIVTSYLISNSLHLILTILERSQISVLRDPDDPMMASTFHTVFSDTVSFVYMFTSAIRIIIYMCNPAVRLHLKDFLPCNYRYRMKRSLSPTTIAVPV
ncbi:unnamed protein product [Wuchereria bancrofti]|uniref:G-protein coupled receptors family 1 profile domain-containing protein n=3 Tax=Wuchereria bancrofti TaxID=6293 RepID=A0A3P7DY32_WUCBA|nr:unnamed protein product [Wuchereria bancrofti]